MTNITDLAREAKLNDFGVAWQMDALERFAALHRAAIIEELTGEMPESLGFMWQHDETGRVGFAEESQRQPWRKGNPRLAIVSDIYTERQMREYAAGLVLKEREACAKVAGELYDGYGGSSREYAAAIRAMGNV